jgi:hypothetical protein
MDCSFFGQRWIARADGSVALKKCSWPRDFPIALWIFSLFEGKTKIVIFTITENSKKSRPGLDCFFTFLPAGIEDPTDFRMYGTELAGF